jgi:hypothetical protein
MVFTGGFATAYQQCQNSILYNESKAEGYGKKLTLAQPE